MRVPFIYWKYGRWYQYLLLYDVDVQSLRTTSNLRIYSSEESTCGEYSSRCGEKRSAGKLEFFLVVLYDQRVFSVGTLVVWQGSWFITIGIIEPCIERCWGVARNVTGNLGLPYNTPARSVGALCRDQVMAPPILIGPLLLPTLLFSPFSPGICLFLVFCIPLFPFVFFSLDQSSFQHGHISSFPNVIFRCTTAQVIFTDTPVPPLQFSSRRQEPQQTSFLQGVALVFLNLFLPSLFLCFPCSKADPNQLNIPETRRPRRWLLSSPLLRSSLPWAPQAVPLYLPRKVSCGGRLLPRSRRVAMYSSGHSDGYYSSTRTTTVVDYTPHGAYRYFTVWSVSKTKVHLKWKLTQPERYGVTCAWMLWLVIVLGSFGQRGMLWMGGAYFKSRAPECAYIFVRQPTPGMLARYVLPRAANICQIIITALMNINKQTALIFRVWVWYLSLIHIWRCRRSTLCRSRWSPYH